MDQESAFPMSPPESATDHHRAPPPIMPHRHFAAGVQPFVVISLTQGGRAEGRGVIAMRRMGCQKQTSRWLRRRGRKRGWRSAGGMLYVHDGDTRDCSELGRR
jgi:hypothetical protein